MKNNIFNHFEDPYNSSLQEQQLRTDQTKLLVANASVVGAQAAYIDTNQYM